MAACEQSWAGRFVIALQLLSWCAVGAILLHRGFSSIQLHQDPYALRTNLTGPVNTRQTVSESTLNAELTDASIRDGLASTHETQTGNVSTAVAGGEFPVRGSAEDASTATDESASTPVGAKTPAHVHNVRVPTPTSTPSKKKYDLTPSGLVMVALGAVMLVVGPSVVILRCCDSASQGRRFNKLSADDPALALAELDLPPAYEEVADTDADRAPRYSMIFPDDFDEEEIRAA